MPVTRTFQPIEKVVRRASSSWHFAGPSRKTPPVVVRRVRVMKKSTKSPRRPTVPKLPPAGPAVLPKPLKPVPPSSSLPRSSGGSSGSASSSRSYAWLRLNGPVLLLNFGSLCTLGGFTRTDVLELRIGNVIGNMCGMTYFAINGLWPPFTWASVFGFTNAYNIYLILVERSDKVVLSKSDQAIYEEHFLPHGLTPMQFSRLMESSTVVRVPKGQVIVRSGERLDCVYLVIGGRTRASVCGRRLTYASSLPGNRLRQKGGDSGAWVGEIAFLECFWKKDQLQRTKTGRKKGETTAGMKSSDSRHNPQTVTAAADPFSENGDLSGSETALQTILAEEDCELRRWSHEDLEDVMKASADMRAAMTRSMTAAVVGKVVNFTVSRSNDKDHSKPTWSNWLDEGKQSGRVTVTREDEQQDETKTTGTRSSSSSSARIMAESTEAADTRSTSASGTSSAVTRPQDAIVAFREVLLSC